MDVAAKKERFLNLIDSSNWTSSIGLWAFNFETNDIENKCFQKIGSLKTC